MNLKFSIIAWSMMGALCVLSTQAHALPQYRRLLEKEYQFKAPCATCHSQGGGSSLSPYGKAFERAGKSSKAVQSIASQIPTGDKLTFGAKLKAKANPNDPASTPDNPGNWAGGSGIPTEELKSFSPAEIATFSILEGELKSDQVEELKKKVGDVYQEEDRYPTFYFGEVGGKKSYVIQYIRAPKLKKTIGLVVSTAGLVKNLSYVGATKEEMPAPLKEKFLGKKLTEVEAIPSAELYEEQKDLKTTLIRGLSSINLVFAKK